MSAAGTLGALTLAIRGTRDLPGRKAVIFVSEGFQLLVREPGDSTRLPDARVRYALDSVIDQATRAGVVIYSLDAAGCRPAASRRETISRAPAPPWARWKRWFAASRPTASSSTATRRRAGLPRRADGRLRMLNTNDLASGLGRITDDCADTM